MGSLSIWHWLVVILAMAIYWVAMGLPFYKILKRVGLSGWWSVFAVIPILNIVLPWIIALSHWRVRDSDQSESLTSIFSN